MVTGVVVSFFKEIPPITTSTFAFTVVALVACKLPATVNVPVTPVGKTCID